MKVQGKSFTSNTTKLLKHLDKLKIIQDGKRPSPVMVHMSLCNPCNLTCSFCCFANRAMTEVLDSERAKLALESFRALGATGVEFTGGGEPTLHPKFDELCKYAYDIGYSLGVCTNGTTLSKWHKKSGLWKYFSYVRLGMYGFTEGYTYNLDVFKGLNTKVTAAYVWDMNIESSENPNITGDWNKPSKKIFAKNYQDLQQFYNMLDWVEFKKIPTRIAFNAIKDPKIVLEDIKIIRKQISDYIENKKSPLQYAFLSDFNYKGERRNDHCYMHMVKPFVYTDGSVYVCPSSELSHENLYDMNNEFKICDIEEISKYYSSIEGGPNISRRHHACKFCKYAMQNELIDDIATETENNEFA